MGATTSLRNARKEVPFHSHDMQGVIATSVGGSLTLVLCVVKSESKYKGVVITSAGC